MKKTVLFLSAMGLLCTHAFAQPTNGLMIHYPFHGNTNDYSVNGRTATTSNTTYGFGQDGIASHSISTANTNSELYYNFATPPEAAAKNALQEFTIATWVKLNSNSNTNYSNICEFGNSDLFFRLNNTGVGGVSTPEFGYFANDGTWQGSGDISVTGQSLAYWQNWNHLVLKSYINPPANDRIFELFVNGAIYATLTVSGSTAVTTINHSGNIGPNETKMAIGYRPGNNILDLDGNLQHFFLYNRALTNNEINTLYTNDFCTPTTSTLTASACNNYSLNGQMYSTSGTYTQTLTNADGCDSTLTLNLTIYDHPTPVVTVTGNTASTPLVSGAIYQWYDCNTGQAINGATNNTFTATYASNYQVVDEFCFLSSDCVSITVLGVEEDLLSDVTLYPNPAIESVKISGLKDEAAVVIVDGTGRMIAQHQVKSSEQSISLAELAAGSYTVVIQSNDKVLRQPLQITK